MNSTKSHSSDHPQLWATSAWPPGLVCCLNAVATEVITSKRSDAGRTLILGSYFACGCNAGAAGAGGPGIG